MEKITSLLNSNATMIENEIENTELLSHELVNIVTSTIDYEKVKNDPIAMEAYKNEVSFLFLNAIKVFQAKSGWVVFDTNAIQNAGILSYSVDNKEYIREVDYDIRKDDLDKSDWWVHAEKNGSSWSNPYFWEPWDANIISYSEQVLIGDILIGVGGSELFFDDISNELNKIKIYDTGYVTLLNSNYDILFDPDSKIIGKNYKTINNKHHETLVNMIHTGDTFGIIEYRENQKAMITAYHKLNNGWILIANPKKHEMYADLNKLNFVLILVIIIIIVLAQVYSRFLSK
jgi:methyl-accepting chemotaxis protein